MCVRRVEKESTFGEYLQSIETSQTSQTVFSAHVEDVYEIRAA